MERPSAPSSPTGAPASGASPYALRFGAGRALVHLGPQPLADLLPEGRGVTVDELLLEIPGARFPLDATGGVEAFRHRRLSVRRLAMSVEPVAILQRVPGQPGGRELDEVQVVMERGRVLLEARIHAGEGRPPSFLLATAAVVPAPPRSVEVVLTSCRVVGAVTANALHLGRDLLGVLGGVEVSPLVRRVEVFRAVAAETAAATGWKVPSVADLRAVDARVVDGRLQLVTSVELEQHVPAQGAQEALVRALAASSLLSGVADVGTVAPSVLDRVALHPLALALVAESGVLDARLRAEVLVAIEDGLRRSPSDLDLLVARTRVDPGPTTYRDLMEAALSQGEPGLVHAAGLQLAALQSPADPAAAARLLARCVEARPSSPDALVRLSEAAAAAEDWAETVRAARRALELALSPADERAAATSLGRARLALKDTPGARRALLRALRGGDVTQPLLLLASASEADGNHSEAVRMLIRAADAAEGRERLSALAHAADLTAQRLGDPAGALALWQGVMASGSGAPWRAAAAEAALAAGDAELALHWVAPGGGEVESERGARVAGLAMRKLGVRTRDAIRLLERALPAFPGDVVLTSALRELRESLDTVVPPRPGPGQENTGTRDAIVAHDEVTAARVVTRPGMTTGAVDRALSDASPNALASMDPDDAATVFLHAWQQPRADREALVATARRLFPVEPGPGMAIALELERLGRMETPDWLLLAEGALGKGLDKVAVAVLQRVLRGRGPSVPELATGLAEKMAGAGMADLALEVLVPAAREQRGLLCEKTVDLLEGLGRFDAALELLGAVEDDAPLGEKVHWLRRARALASMAGEHTAAVEIARRAAERGQAEDADALEDVLQAAGDHPGLAAVLWDRAYTELDAARAARAVRLELTPSGRGGRAAVSALVRVIEHGLLMTPTLWSAIEDLAAAAPDAATRAQVLLLLLDAEHAGEEQRRSVIVQLEALPLEDADKARLDEAIVRRWPQHVAARARIVRRYADKDPARAVAEALALEEQLAARDTRPAERLTWLQFAAAQAREAPPAVAAQALERLSEFSRRETAAARAAGVDRRSVVLRLAGLYEELAQPMEAARVLGHAEALDGSPEERAEVLRHLARLEERALGRPDRAAEALVRALRANPDDDDAARTLGGLLELLGRWEELAALHAERAERAAGPSRVAHLLALGDVLARQLGRGLEAVAAYRQAVAAAPVSDAPLRRLAELQRDKPAGLVRSYLRAARLRGRENGVDLVRQAARVLSTELVRPRLAVAAWQAVLKVERRHAEAWQQLVSMHRFRKDHEAVARALAGMADAVEDPALARQARVERAEVLGRILGRDDQAWLELKGLLDAGQDLGAGWELAGFLTRRLGLAEAYEQVLEQRVHTAASEEERRLAQLEGARALLEMGAAPAALRWARRATEQLPTQPTAWSVLRDVAVLAHHLPAQIDATRALVNLLGPTQPRLAADESEHLAGLLSEAQQPAAAARALGRALELDPARPGLPLRLGRALLAAGDAPEAWAILSRIKPADASDFGEEAFARVLAQAASGAGVFESVDAWRKVAELAPADRDAWMRLGGAAESVGAWTQAADAWARAAALATGEERARLLRRQARAEADAGRPHAAADALERARAEHPGPAEEGVRVARWRVDAGEVAAAAAALVNVHDAGGAIPEELVVEIAARLHQDGDSAHARVVALLVDEPRSMALARLRLELAPESMEPPAKARLMERIAAETPGEAAATWWERAAELHASMGDTAAERNAALQAMEAAPSSSRAARAWTFALAAGEWDAATRAFAAMDEHARSAAADSVTDAELIQSLPAELLATLAAHPPPRAVLVRERVRRAGSGDAPDLEVLQGAVEAGTHPGADEETRRAADAAARRLGILAAADGDAEQALVWHARIAAPTTSDLANALQWNLVGERWSAALDCVAALLKRPDVDAGALHEQAVEIARDRLEDPVRALEHARSWSLLRPGQRTARAAFVELLEETGALAEASRLVAQWAAASSGVEALALWRRAAQLASEAGEADRAVAAARAAWELAPEPTQHQLLVDALTARGDQAGVARQWEASWRTTRDLAHARHALDAYVAAGDFVAAADLALNAWPTPLHGDVEDTVLGVLARARRSDDLRRRLDQAGPAASTARRRVTHLQRPALPDDALADALERVGREDAPFLSWAALAHVSRGDIPAAGRLLAQTRPSAAVGLTTQLDAVIDVAVLGRPAGTATTVGNLEDAGWLQGRPLPDDVGDLESRPSWVLRRLEDVAVRDDRPALAARALAERVSRGEACSGQALMRRSWLSDPDARPVLLELVERDEALGAAATDLVADKGAEAVREVAEAWARTARAPETAARAWDRVAQASVDLLDIGAELAALKHAQRFHPNARRARRLLEAARAMEDVDAQLEHLRTLVTVEPRNAAHWRTELAQVLLQLDRLGPAMDVLEQTGAAADARALWTQLYEKSVAAGDEAVQFRALNGLAGFDGVHALAWAALAVRQRDPAAAHAALGRARALGEPATATGWIAVEVATLEGDDEGHRAALRALADAGVGEAARLLAALSGGTWSDRVASLAPLVRARDASAAAALLRDLAMDPDVPGGVVRAALEEALADLAEAAPLVAQLVDRQDEMRGADLVVAWLAEASLSLGMPEVAEAAWRVQANGSGPAASAALGVLAEIARRRGDRHGLVGALLELAAIPGTDPQVHDQVARELEGSARWPHVLASAVARRDVRAGLLQVAAEAAHAADKEWELQARVAAGVAARTGDAAADEFGALAGPATPGALLALVDRARRVGNAPALTRYLHAAVRSGILDSAATHAELAELLAAGAAGRALGHARRAAELAPTDSTAAARWVDLAGRAGNQRELAQALRHALSLQESPDLDVVVEAAGLFAGPLDEPGEALRLLAHVDVPDPRVVELRRTLAVRVGDAAEEARALESAVAQQDDGERQLALAWDAVGAWRRAGESQRSLSVLIGLAAISADRCARALASALERGEHAAALSVVRARWVHAAADERRKLLHAWLATVDEEGVADADVLGATRDLVHMQVTADEGDLDARLWTARDAEHNHRWEAAAQEWVRLARLVETHGGSPAVVRALQTEGVAVLARTGSLDEAEKLARARLGTHPSDRGALEVVLAAARGRGDAEEVVRCLQAMALGSDSLPEQAFLWREVATWLGGVLSAPDRALEAWIRAAEGRPLQPDELETVASLAADAGREDLELHALEQIVALKPARAAALAARRFDLKRRAGAPATDLVLILQPLMQSPRERLGATELIADTLTERELAAGILPWLRNLEPPAAADEAARHWRAVERVARTAGDNLALVRALEKRVELGEERARPDMARALIGARRHAEAAAACLDVAGRQGDAMARAAWLRQAATQYEAAGDPSAADDTRLKVLEADPTDVGVFEALEVRLRRQGKTARLPELALTVARAQHEPPARAHMFERAAFLLRDVAGDETAAAAAFEQAVQADPFRSRSLLALADLAYRRNNPRDAANWFARVPDSADHAYPEVPPAELAFRRGICLEATGGDGRAALRRALDLDGAHRAARDALVEAARRRGDSSEAARIMEQAADAPSAAEDPRAYAAWTLRRAELKQGAGDLAGALELLQRAQEELPSSLPLVGALARALSTTDAVKATSLFRRAAQLDAAGGARANWLREEARAWATAQRPAEQAAALADAAIETPSDLALVVEAFTSAARAEQDSVLLRLANAIHRAGVQPALGPEVHAATATALQQDARSDGGALLFHAQAALQAADTWGLRLKAVEGARRCRAWPELVAHVEIAVGMAPDPRMASVLAADAVRIAFTELDEPARGAALLGRAVALSPRDATLAARLGDLFPEPIDEPAQVERAARAVLDAGLDFPPVFRWLERLAHHRNDARRGALARQARLLAAGDRAPIPAEPGSAAETARAVSMSRDAAWLLPTGFPARMARLTAALGRELHAVVPRPPLATRTLAGDEARRLAPDIRFARSLVDGNLPIVVIEDEGAVLGGALAPQLAVGRDVLRAPDAVRRAVLACAFAAVRWGLEPSLLCVSAELADLGRALSAVFEREVESTEFSRDMADRLKRALDERAGGELDPELVVAALKDGRLPTADEARAVLARVAFLATGDLAATADALARMGWMEGRAATTRPWWLALLAWACLDEAVEIRARLGLETLDV